jgi:hypothetical protein
MGSSKINREVHDYSRNTEKIIANSSIDTPEPKLRDHDDHASSYISTNKKHLNMRMEIKSENKLTEKPPSNYMGLHSKHVASNQTTRRNINGTLGSISPTKKKENRLS